MKQYIDLVQDVQGNALVGVTVLVQNYVGGGNASIFSDNGLTPIANSTVTSGADGSFSFFAADGDYNLVFSKNSTVYKTQSPVSIFDGSPQITYTDTGSANAYAIANSTLEKALRTGLRASFKAANASTSSATFQYNGLAAAGLVIPPASALPSGAIQAGGIYAVEYDGTNWQLRGATSSIAPYFALTSAELTLGITPFTYIWPEGDIRRYGATTGATDNSAAINNALKISGTGSISGNTAGSACYIPPGTWSITSSLVAVPGSSMYGNGHTSIISVANGVDGIQFTTGDAGEVAQPRFFRDFQLVGVLSGSANTAHGIYSNVTGLGLDQILFSNLAIFNFNYGAYVEGMYYCTFFACWIQNCWNGIAFINQSANVWVTNCTIQLTSSGTLITGSGYSQGISCSGAPEVEGLHITGGSIYGFNYDINLALCFEVQIEAVDISYATVCPIYMTSTIGGLVIRDCWIELASSASGTWNDKISSGDGNLTGIFIAAITPSVNAKVAIENNYINSDVTIAGAMGIYLGNANNGITVHKNQIYGFDVGISGGNTLNSVGATLTGASIKWNTINIVVNTTSTGVYSSSSASIVLGSSSLDVEIGPNYVITGTGAAATASVGTSITVPNQSTAGNQQFPVNTPVQCTTTAAGFFAGVTYWIASSSTTTVTLAATKGGSAISGTAATSIGTLVQAPLPVNYSAGTPAGTTLFARGAFILTLSDPAVSGEVFYQANGKSVTLNLNSSLSGTSTATTMTATGVPPFLAPFASHNFIPTITNSGTAAYGLGSVAATTAALTFYATPGAGAFTASGLKALGGTDFSWSMS